MSIERLPVEFSALDDSAVSGVVISDVVLDPAIQIARSGEIIHATLAGLRRVKGQQEIYPAPTNQHGWVVAGAKIHPLPRDAPAIFLSAIPSPDCLTYADALRLIRRPPPGFEILESSDLHRSGAVSALLTPTTCSVEGLHATLFQYQAQGVNWMSNAISKMGGVVLADEMGLGKTIQVIALLLSFKPSNESPALVICPSSLIANWVRELERFAPSLTVHVHRGPNRAGIARGLKLANVVITTYETAVIDAGIMEGVRWKWLICDEAQAIKNPDSQRRRAVARFSREYAIPLTGTLVENRLLDLWSIVDIAIPGVLGSRDEFEELFPDSEDGGRAVSETVFPVVLRRLVKHVASDLPERIDIDIPIELDEHLVRRYEDVRQRALDSYPVAGALITTLQLQLFCAHPWLVLRSVANAEDASLDEHVGIPMETAKLELAGRLIREAALSGRKVIVFSAYNRVGPLLQASCSSPRRISWSAINGSTPQEERQPLVDEFTRHEGAAVLVLNPKAAGVGLNITAATVVIHLTPLWNPAVESQASARAHRRGQTEPVTVYRLYYQATIEQVMIERAQWKSQLASDAVPISSREEGDVIRALHITPEGSDESEVPEST